MALFAKKTWLRKSHVLFALRIMGFPQELKTMRFNLEPKRCKSVSLSAKRSVSTLVALGGVVTEKLRFPYKSLNFVRGKALLTFFSDDAVWGARRALWRKRKWWKPRRWGACRHGAQLPRAQNDAREASRSQPGYRNEGVAGVEPRHGSQGEQSNQRHLAQEQDVERRAARRPSGLRK